MDNIINGRTPEEIKKGLECCACSQNCLGCPYEIYHKTQEDIEEVEAEEAEVCGRMCMDCNGADALAYIQQLESEKWELFDLLSSAWYGKQTYFKQEDGTVYSRMSGEYLSFDQAINEFACRLTPIEWVE